MEMTIKKCGLILAILTCFLVGISSGYEPGFFGVPYEQSSDASELFGISDGYEPGFFGVPYESDPSELFDTSGWFNSYYKPVNFSEYFYPTQKEPEVTNPLDQWKPEPIIMPQPLSISKEDLFKSKSLISTQKQSLISSSIGHLFF